MYRVVFGILFLGAISKATSLPVTINTGNTILTSCPLPTAACSGPFSLIAPNTFSGLNPQNGDVITATFNASATFDSSGNFFMDFRLLVSPFADEPTIFGNSAVADAYYTGFLTVSGGTGSALVRLIPGGIAGVDCVNSFAACSLEPAFGSFVPIVFGQPTPVTLHGQIVLFPTPNHFDGNFAAHPFLEVRETPNGNDLPGMTFTFSDPVPEPAGISLGGLGLVFLGIWAQREKLRNCSLSARIRARQTDPDGL